MQSGGAGAHEAPPAMPAGKAFPKEYTKDLKQAMMESGKIDKTRCPDYYFF